MYEIQLSRRALVAGGSALALAAGLVFLCGLLLGLGWSPAAARLPSPSDPTGQASTPEIAAAPAPLPLDVRPRREAAEAGAATFVAVEEKPRSAAGAPERMRLVAVAPRPVARAAAYRRFEQRDPWFRFSEPVPLTPFGELIYRVSRRHRMSPRLVAAVVWAESAFDPAAVSTKGARGLMQVMPATANRFGIRADRLFDPETNLDVGVRYLRFLSERYAGDMLMILAAYNAGEGAVDDYRDVPPFPETRNFIHRVASLLELGPLGGDRLD